MNIKSCDICGETEKRIIRHHIDYEKDITIPLCDKCHANLHKGNLDVNIPAPKRPTDQKRINLNIPDEIVKCLDKLCKHTWRNRTQMLHFLIEREHRKLKYEGE